VSNRIIFAEIPLQDQRSSAILILTRESACIPYFFTASTGSFKIIGTRGGKRMSIRVVLFDDHPPILEYVTSELEKHADIRVVSTSKRGSDLLRLVRETSPDVVILDLRYAGDEDFHPLEAVHDLFRAYPDIGLVILTGDNSLYAIKELIKAGALGYILKNDDLALNLPLVIRSVSQSVPFQSPLVQKRLQAESAQRILTTNETNLLRLLNQGLSNEQIGAEMNLSESRVKGILREIYAKLGIREDSGVYMRVALINKAKQLGLLSPDMF
jgi:DNA-binding NarL/FixJ family response regulator